MAFVFFILITIFVIFWRVMDALITIKAQKDGYGKGATGIVASKGKFSPWKATVAIGILEVAFWIAFLNIEHTAEYVAIMCVWKGLTGVASMWAYYSNKKDIRNRRPRSGGII